MSDKKAATWWGSFDHIVSGYCAPAARRQQGDREAKYDRPYGPDRPKAQTPAHNKDGATANGGEDTSSVDKDTQDGADKVGGGVATSSDSKMSKPVVRGEQDEDTQGEDHADMEELIPDAALGNKLPVQQQHLQQQDQQQQELVTDQQQLPADQNDEEDESLEAT